MANEKRIRYAILPVATLSVEYDPLTDTTMQAPEFADYPEVTSTAHLPLWVNRDREDFSGFAAEPYLVYITAHTLSSTTVTVAEAPENVIDRYYVPAGCKVHHGLTVRDFFRTATPQKLTAGSYTQAATPWNYLGGGSPVTLTVPAFPGDILKLSAVGLWGSEASSGFLAGATWDGANLQQFFGSGEPTTTTGDGVPGWFGQASALETVGGSAQIQVTAASIVSGICTVRMRQRCTGATKQLFATSLDPLEISLEAYVIYEPPVLPTFS